MDDMYPNDGTFFGGVPLEPLEQRLSRRKERSLTLEALPVLQDVLRLLNDDIAFYSSVDSIPDDVKSDPTQFLIMHNANELVRNVLQSKKEWIEGLIAANTKTT